MSIVMSRNLFIDTSSDLQGGFGDNVTLQLGADSIHASSGQQIRLTLSYFCMYRNYYNINENNSKVRVTTDAGSTEINITKSNYQTMGQIVSNFAHNLAAQVLADAQSSGSSASTATVQNVTPDPTTYMPSGNRLMSFTIVFNAPHTLTQFTLQSFEAVGESYEILGGNRIKDITDTSTSSYNVSIASTTQLTVTGFYPMQRSTDSHICLRCSLPSTNIQMSSFSSATGPYNTQTMTSNILAMIPQDIEYTSFTSSTDGEFFLNLAGAQNLSSLRLFLTDHKNRPLGRIAGSGSQTAAGTGGAQSTLGNLSFRAILRIDVIQASIPQTLQTKLPVATVPARFTGVLNNLETDP